MSLLNNPESEETISGRDADTQDEVPWESKFAPSQDKFAPSQDVLALLAARAQAHREAVRTKNLVAVSIALPAACVLFALCLLGSSCFAETPLRDWPLVSKSAKDANVRAVQLLLAVHGYKISPDGLFGAATQKVLRQFQSAHNLVATGETNNPTWEALIVTVQQNDRGPAVRAAQYELRNEGYGVAANGVFGAQTKASVQEFQKQTGHTADGAIGRRTWYELVGGDSSPGD